MTSTEIVCFKYAIALHVGNWFAGDASPVNRRESGRTEIRFLHLSSSGSFSGCSQPFDELKGLNARRQLQIGNLCIMTNIDTQNNHFHLGIDVAKDKLDIHCLESGQDWQIDNCLKELSKFARDNDRLLGKSYVTIEATGGYEVAACQTLHTKGYRVHQANSFRVKSYVRSLGQEAKTDKLDARALAGYGRERKQTLRLYQPVSANQQNLKSLVMRREELIKMHTQEKNRLAGPQVRLMTKELQSSFRAILKALAKQVSVIEKNIAKCIARDEGLTAKAQVLLAIKGIGQTTCNALLGLMPELGMLDRKQVGALAGLAPYAKDSGNNRGYRSIKGGRHAVRRALFMAALSAVRFNETLRTFYLRLRSNGKKPIVAMIATARKLATIANAKVRDMELS